MTIIYLKPSATGTGLGTDWDNANTMANFAAVYTASLPGDQIWLSSVGTHVKTGTTTLTNANNPTAASPIRIRGMRPYGTVQGHPEKAFIIGSRTAPWPQVGPGGVSGGTLFNLSTGAKYTRFENIVAMNQDIGIKLASADNVGIQISDYEAINVRAGFSCGVTVSALRIRRFKVIGFLLYGIYVAGDSSDIVIEDGEVNSLSLDDDSITTGSTGVFLDQTAHAARIRRVQAIGGFDLRADASYWQGQGFGVEEGCNDVICEDCYAANWPDAGWDAKASNQILRRCVAEYNMRNFRGSAPTLPNSPKIFEDCISRYPIYRGGSGSAAHIQMAAGVSGRVNTVDWKSTIGRSLFEDHDPVTPIVNMTSSFSTCTITDALIRKHPDSPLSSGGGTPTFTNPLYELES